MRRVRDRGVTVIELTAVIAIAGVLSTALLAGTAVILRASPRVSRTIAENHDQQQALNYLYDDVRSTPAVAVDSEGELGYSRAVDAAGCGAPDGGLNVLQLTWSDGASVERASYRLRHDDGTTRLDRFRCTRGLDGVFADVRMINIADALDAVPGDYKGSGPPANAEIDGGVVTLRLYNAGREVQLAAGLQSFSTKPTMPPETTVAPTLPTTTTTTTIPPSTTSTTSTTTTTTVPTTTTTVAVPTETTTTSTSTTTTSTTTTTTTLAPVTVPTPASSTPVNPLAPAQGFAVMSAGNVMLNATASAGAVAAGKQFRYREYRNVAATAASTLTIPGESTATGLMVGDSVDFASSGNGSLTVANGFAHVGSLTGSYVQTNGTAVHIVPSSTPSNNNYSVPRVMVSANQSNQTQQPVLKPGAFPFENTFVLLQYYAQRMAQLTPTTCSSVVYPDFYAQYGNYVLNLVPGKVNVLNITASQVSSIGNVSGSTVPSSTTPLVVNVTDAGPVSIPAKYWAPWQNGDRASIIWNLPNATSVSVGSVFYGTLFAPSADVTMSATQLFGDVVVKSLTTSGGSLELAHFARTLSCIV